MRRFPDQPFALLLAVLILAGCRTAPAPVTAPAAAATAAAAAATPPRASHWVVSSAEYRASVVQAYRLATERLEARATGLAPGAWAVALDADETVISNAQYDRERVGLGGFSEESWDVWVRRREATPMPGAVAFLDRVRALGGKIVIVTNRDDEHCPDTEANFREQAIPYDLMLCRPEGERRKEKRWQRVEDGTASDDLPPLEIVLWLGDNIHDFPDLDQDLREMPPEAFARFGVDYVVFPNPMYGSWTDNPWDDQD